MVSNSCLLGRQAGVSKRGRSKQEAGRIFEINETQSCQPQENCHHFIVGNPAFK